MRSTGLSCLVYSVVKPSVVRNASLAYSECLCCFLVLPTLFAVKSRGTVGDGGVFRVDFFRSLSSFAERLGKLYILFKRYVWQFRLVHCDPFGDASKRAVEYVFNLTFFSAALWGGTR